MARIRGKDTKPELIVRRYLYSRGYRYLKNVKRLPGTPDIVLRKYNHNLDMNYKAYFKNNIIAIEDIMNKKTFELKNNDY